MPDQIITCMDCSSTFTFSESEARWFKTKGFTPPKRCKPCREKKKAQRERDER